jgi:hypothetical protein
MDPFKELIFGADRTRAISVYLSEHFQEYEQLATLFPYQFVQKTPPFREGMNGCYSLDEEVT